MRKFLCLAIDRKTQKTLFETEVEASDWYYARHLAAAEFERAEICKNLPIGSWYIDSIELEE